MKKTLLAAITVLLLFACSEVETSFATIYFYFSPDAEFGAGAATFETNSATWTIEQAQVIFGEIGIHWEATWAPENTGRATRHEVEGGRPAPVIHRFFAIDLLADQFIQMLTVETGAFDHVHKSAHNINSLSGGDMGRREIVGIENFPETLGNIDLGPTFFFSGTVKPNNEEARNFTLRTREVFLENDLGDVLFHQEVLDGEAWEFRLRPRLSSWFSGINASNLVLETNGDIAINDLRNHEQLNNFLRNFTASNAMHLTRDRR